MALSTAQLQALSRLLDAGLALPVAQREAWLAALAPADRELAPQLRRLLGEHALPSPGRLLDDLPALGPLPWAGEAALRLGPYRLIEPLGRGGMGEVWRAVRSDGAFERVVALKLPRLRLGLGQDLAARLRVECRILARLEHPHIARLYDGGVDEAGRPWIASELIDGPDLEAGLAGQPLAARLQVLERVARAVDHAHRRGVLHCDLKPGNVLLAGDGDPRLVDFGIGALVGAPDPVLPRALTPRYAAAELRAGGADSVQADIFSLGVMAQDLLGPGPLGADLRAVIATACDADPARRYRSASRFADELAACARGDPVEARPQQMLARGRRALRRHGTLGLAVAACGVAVLAGGLGVWKAHEASRLADQERLVRGFAAELSRMPDGASGGTGSALLDRGAGLIATRFAGDAALQAELYGVAGQAYADMGAFRLALDHRERQLAALRTLPRRGMRVGELLTAEIELAHAQWQLGDPDAALAHLRAARAEPVGSPAWRQAELLAARAAVDLGRFEAAGASLAALAPYLPTHAASVEAAWAAATQAEVVLRNGQLDEGFRALEAAAATARRAEGPDSLQAAFILLRGVSQAGMAERREMAERWVAEAVQVLRARGGAFEVRAVVEQARMWRALAATLRPVSMREAVGGIQDCLDELRRLGARAPPLLIAEVEGRLGDVRFDFGDVGGAALIEEHYALRLAAARRPMEAVALHGVAAAAAAEVGLYDQALARSRARHEARLAAGRGDHPNVAVDLRQQALIQSMAGRREAALAVLDSAPAADAIRVVTGLEPPWYTNVLAEARSRVLLDAGLPGQALAVLPRRAALPQDFVLVGLMTAPDALRGEALCQLGRPVEGWPLLREHIARLNPNRDPHAASVARLKAVAASCAEAAGAHAASRRLAAEARATFAARPQVADYFKAPLNPGIKAMTPR